jgi:hypothetical protein
MTDTLTHHNGTDSGTPDPADKRTPAQQVFGTLDTAASRNASHAPHLARIMTAALDVPEGMRSTVLATAVRAFAVGAPDAQMAALVAAFTAIHCPDAATPVASAPAAAVTAGRRRNRARKPDGTAE